MIRNGNGGRGLGAHIAISEDGGATWKALASDPPGGGGGMGNIAISADGRVIVWTPGRGGAWATSDRGVTWTNCQGLSAGAVAVADPVNPARFYSLSASGKLMASTNGAATFEATAGTVTASPALGGGAFCAATPGLEGDVWVGSRSGGLYHSTDGGAAFSKVEAVGAAQSLGFG
jgi:photosystem II stability/assembly factor-like uncharacterized protein